MIHPPGAASPIAERAIRGGKRRILNEMRHTGMLPASKRTNQNTPVIAKTTSWVRAPESGIVGGKVNLGTSVAEGQKMAVISDPLGDAETVVPAPFDGIVIGRTNLPLAHEGDALVNLASFTDVAKAEDRVETFTEVHDVNSSTA